MKIVNYIITVETYMISDCRNANITSEGIYSIVFEMLDIIIKYFLEIV